MEVIELLLQESFVNPSAANEKILTVLKEADISETIKSFEVRLTSSQYAQNKELELSVANFIFRCIYTRRGSLKKDSESLLKVVQSVFHIFYTAKPFMHPKTMTKFQEILYSVMELLSDEDFLKVYKDYLSYFQSVQHDIELINQMLIVSKPLFKIAKRKSVFPEIYDLQKMVFGFGADLLEKCVQNKTGDLDLYTNAYKLFNKILRICSKSLHFSFYKEKLLSILNCTLEFLFSLYTQGNEDSIKLRNVIFTFLFKLNNLFDKCIFRQGNYQIQLDLVNQFINYLEKADVNASEKEIKKETSNLLHFISLAVSDRVFSEYFKGEPLKLLVNLIIGKIQQLLIIQSSELDIQFSFYLDSKWKLKNEYKNETKVDLDTLDHLCVIIENVFKKSNDNAKEICQFITANFEAVQNAPEQAVLGLFLAVYLSRRIRKNQECSGLIKAGLNMVFPFLISQIGVQNQLSELLCFYFCKIVQVYLFDFYQNEENKNEFEFLLSGLYSCVFAGEEVIVQVSISAFSALFKEDTEGRAKAFVMLKISEIISHLTSENCAVEYYDLILLVIKKVTDKSPDLNLQIFKIICEKINAINNNFIFKKEIEKNIITKCFKIIQTLFSNKITFLIPEKLNEIEDLFSQKIACFKPYVEKIFFEEEVVELALQLIRKKGSITNENFFTILNNMPSIIKNANEILVEHFELINFFIFYSNEQQRKAHVESVLVTLAKQYLPKEKKLKSSLMVSMLISIAFILCGNLSEGTVYELLDIVYSKLLKMHRKNWVYSSGDVFEIGYFSWLLVAIYSAFISYSDIALDIIHRNNTLVAFLNINKSLIDAYDFPFPKMNKIILVSISQIIIHSLFGKDTFLFVDIGFRLIKIQKKSELQQVKRREVQKIQRRFIKEDDEAEEEEKDDSENGEDDFEELNEIISRGKWNENSFDEFALFSKSIEIYKNGNEESFYKFYSNLSEEEKKQYATLIQIKRVKIQDGDNVKYVPRKILTICKRGMQLN